MEKNEVQNSYINMIMGSIGMLVVVGGMIKYLASSGNSPGYQFVFFGFIIMVHYIYYLEKKTGINNKLIWFRIIILMIATIGFGYAFY